VVLEVCVLPPVGGGKVRKVDGTFRNDLIRMRVLAQAVEGYRLDGNDPIIAASGQTVFGFGMAKQISRRMELNSGGKISGIVITYETQNYFESRVPPLP
jgi:hypothetical protein